MVTIRDSIKTVHGERLRKGERGQAKQQEMIDELNKQIDELNQQIEKLAQDHAGKGDELKKLQDSNESVDMSEVNPDLRGFIERYIESSKERRHFQDEAERLPPDWDQLFKKFIQEQSSNLKNAMNEYPSNQNFPDVLNDYISAMTELYNTDVQYKADQRKQLAQIQKMQILGSIGEDVNDIKTKLDDQNVKFNESLYADKIKEKRERIKSQKLEAQTLVTELKTFKMMDLEFDKMEKFEWTDIKQTPDFTRYSEVTSRTKQARIELGELERANENKLNCVQNKDEYIERLKQEIELKLSQPRQESEPVLTTPTPQEHVDIGEMMRLQIETSAVPLVSLKNKGEYLFGTKRIHAKILDNALVIRVGGGYVGIEEFTAKYTHIELVKVNRLMKQEAVEEYQELGLYKDIVVRCGLHDKNRRFEVPKVGTE